MDSDSNPYASPPDAAKSSDKIGVDFVPILRRWERFRLIYNATLVLLVVALTLAVFPKKATNIRFWASVCFGGGLANLCFFLAPAIEGYGTYLRMWNPTASMLLFVTGLGFTALLAFVSIATF